MTDRPRQIPVAAIAGALFCLLLIYLALQVRAGNDPAIGAGQQTVAAPPRQVIVRRVIVRRIVASGSRSPAPAAPAPAAPAPAAPVPAAPAAPAPAPVVSQGS